MRACILAIPLLLVGCENHFTSVSISPDSVDLHEKGETTTLKAYGKAGEGKSTNIVAVDWTSSDPSVATVEEGKVTALKSGQTVITAAVGNVKGSCKVTVFIAQSVEVSPSPVEMVGIQQQATLSATVKDDNGKVAPGAVVFWKVHPQGIVAVSEGKLTSLAPGTAKVTAEHAGVSTTVDVTVKLPDFAKLSVTPEKQLLGPGEGLKFTATPLDAAGKEVPMVPVTWSTTDEKVATVTADGVVTAVAKGKAKLMATSGTKSASADLIVVED